MLKEIMEALENREIEKATMLLDNNESVLGENSSFIHLKAKLKMLNGDYRSAICILNDLLIKEPDNKDTHFYLSCAYRMLDKINSIENQDITSSITIKDFPSRVVHEKGKQLPERKDIYKSLLDPNVPLVSIILLAYNKLSYTKECIESIYRHTTNVDYELILVDNGSIDGTFEYFKSLPKRRIVRLTNNQGCIGGFNEGVRQARGKYVAVVCNDFIFTKNWLSNLVTCIESDDTIGYVAPGASTISNFQQIDIVFSDFDDMQAKAAQYNVSDPTKWEERVKLMPTVLCVRREVLDVVGFYDPAFYYGEFGDDDMSFRIRRAGYKLIYCGDTYVYHHGSVTVGVDQRENNSLLVSREVFKKKYRGIDTWSDIRYDYNLVNSIDIEKYDKSQCIKILSVEPRCGNTLLLMKNKLIHNGFEKIELYAYTEHPKYYEDLASICTGVFIGEVNSIHNVLKNNRFDCVFIDESINTFGNGLKVLIDIVNIVEESGQIALSLMNQKTIDFLVSILSNQYLSNEPIKSLVLLEDINTILTSQMFRIDKVIGERLSLNPTQIERITSIVRKVSLASNYEELLKSVLLNRYIMRVSKMNNIES